MLLRIYNNKAILFFVLATVLMASCKKFIDAGTPIDRITAATAFSNDASATTAVNGIYSQMQPVLPFIFNGGVTFNAGLSADELVYTGSGADQQAINNNSILPNNTTITTELWTRAYTHVYHANACIEGLNNSVALSTAVKQRLLGEVRFLRGLFYFYLINFYGDVPLVTSTSYETNALLPRTATSIIYDSIKADLQYAAGVLPVSNQGKLRPSKYAAKALLARVHLYLGEWQEAETLSGEVIIAGVASMVTNLNNVFLANSNEAIWQLVPVSTTQNTLEGNRFVPLSATIIPGYTITPSLLNAFETGDQRKASWLKQNTVSGTPYHHPYKYKVRTSTTLTEYYMVLRLAEQYLIRAEARAQQDKLAEARADINVIRTRAGLAATAVNTKAGLLAVIEQERRIELLAEWGHRWFDLKRTNRATPVLQPVKSNWQPEDMLYPIPQSEILANPFLVQNPGY